MASGRWRCAAATAKAPLSHISPRVHGDEPVAVVGAVGAWGKTILWIGVGAGAPRHRDGSLCRCDLAGLSEREHARLLREGIDHVGSPDKPTNGEAGRCDYYRDKTTGEIYLVPKSEDEGESGGDAIPTGLGK